MEVDKGKSNACCSTADGSGVLHLLLKIRLAFWLTVPMGAMVGFFLAREKFGGGFDVSAIAISGAILLAILAAYMISFRRFGMGRILCTAGGWGVWVLLGASAGGGIAAWEIIAAAIILGAYCGTVEIVAVQSESQIPQKFGLAAWAFSVLSITACVGFAVVSFSTHGIAGVSPWVSVWITLWVSSRSVYCSILLRKRIAPETANQLAIQLQRGVLLLQAGILTGLLQNQTGALGFVVAMILLGVCNFLDKRSKD